MVRLRWLLLSLVVAGCTTDHDSLARRPPASGGAAGSGGSGGTGVGAGNTGNVSSGGRIDPDYEPPGTNVLSIVNGVVDAESVRLCFARAGADGLSSEFVGEPLPPLPYAATTVLTAIEGFDPAADAIQPWVLAGDFSLLEGLDCEASVQLADEQEAEVTPADPVEEAGQGGAGPDRDEPGMAGAEAGGGGGAAGGADGTGAGGEAAEPAPPLERPLLRARPLAALPPGSLITGRSVLMVLTGCLGGAYYHDAVEASVCGRDYAPEQPSVQPILVKLSRDLALDKVGLQAVHGSLAVGTVDVRAGGGLGATPLIFASGVGFGGIEPRPADVRFTPAELGVSAFDSGLEAADRDGVLLKQSWSAVREASGITDILVARSYTAVLIGPDPLLVKRGWWNDSAFSLVDNDPTRPAR